MKLLRFGPAGHERPGMLDTDGVMRSLVGIVDDIAAPTLTPEALERLRVIDPTSLPVVDEGTRLGPPVADIGNLVCIGLNYRDHAAETGLPLPTEPVMFLKSRSSISGPNDEVFVPRDATKMDYEVELGIVIGVAGTYISEADALHHVAGFTVVNDVSERAYQFERNGSWDKDKSFDSFGPIGLWVVTRDDIPDPGELRIWLEVNGHTRQDSSTSPMIFGIAQIVAYVSQFLTLHPGDVIATGTPAGVAMGLKPEPNWLQEGDTVRLGIDGLGEQRQRIVLFEDQFA